MEGIKDRVAIIGMGCTKFGEHWDKGVEHLLAEAAAEAYEDAGIEAKDIQAAWLGTYQSGRTGQILSHALKFEYIPITRCENACGTGTDAFRNACYAVASGVYDIVMAAGVEKLKDSGFSGLPLMAEVVTSGVMPATPAPSSFALSATRYFHHYGLSYEEGKRTLAKIAVKNHHNGSMNPRAHFRREITEEQAVNAPMIAWPLGLFDCCGVSDGSAVAVITRPELAKKFRDDYILVKGLGLTCGGMQGTLQDDYDFVHFPENVTASQLAYKEAGIKNPRKELSLAVVHDCFTITELLIYEDLQWSQRGRAREDIEAGTFTLQGELPVNTDGGLKCFGHPIGASGLRMIYEIYKQLQGKAGERQVRNPTLGLTHNLGGRPGSFTCAVSILGRRD
ncbi:MAG: acetyl-CoA acetyltransferase [Chloroflexi bacterium]|nr:acetyl-CoA acetyltransferase [Chloroflexota bacterium]